MAEKVKHVLMMYLTIVSGTVLFVNESWVGTTMKGWF